MPNWPTNYCFKSPSEYHCGHHKPNYSICCWCGLVFENTGEHGEHLSKSARPKTRHKKEDWRSMVAKLIAKK